LIRKRQKHEEEGNSERWLVSYADFITLLFAFFTTLYAISTVNADKAGKLVNSMRAAFDTAIFEQGSRTLSISKGGGAAESSEILQNHPSQKNANLNERILKRTDAGQFPTKKTVLSGEKDLGRFKRTVESSLGEDVLKGRVRTHIEARGLVISVGENGVFDSGSDQIKPEGIALVDTIGASLVSVGNQVRIEGHTDNVPISNWRFPSNWELSTARATAVISHLIVNFGLKPELVSAAGYAEYRPCATNSTEEGKARNRRVDIVVLDPAAAGVEPK